MNEKARPPTVHIVAAVLMGIKALLGLWAASVLFKATALRPRRFLGQAVHRRAKGIGLLLLIFVAVTVVAIVALMMAKSWAPMMVYVIEGLASLFALIAITRRPKAAIVALIFSGAILALTYAGARATNPPTPTY